MPYFYLYEFFSTFIDFQVEIKTFYFQMRTFFTPNHVENVDVIYI